MDTDQELIDTELYGMDLRKEIARACLEKEGGVIQSENLDRFLEEVEESYFACEQYHHVQSLRRLEELGPDYWPFDDLSQKKEGEADFSETTP